MILFVLALSTFTHYFGIFTFHSEHYFVLWFVLWVLLWSLNSAVKYIKAQDTDEKIE